MKYSLEISILQGMGKFGGYLMWKPLHTDYFEIANLKVHKKDWRRALGYLYSKGLVTKAHQPTQEEYRSKYQLGKTITVYQISLKGQDFLERLNP